MGRGGDFLIYSWDNGSVLGVVCVFRLCHIIQEQLTGPIVSLLALSTWSSPRVEKRTHLISLMLRHHTHRNHAMSGIFSEPHGRKSME